MITAAEAKALTQSSDAVLDTQLNNIGIAITRAAGLGKTSIILDWELPNSNIYTIVKQPYYEANYTQPQARIKTALEKNGYRVSIHKEMGDVPRGLASDDDQPGTYASYHIQVWW